MATPRWPFPVIGCFVTCSFIYGVMFFQRLPQSMQTKLETFSSSTPQCCEQLASLEAAFDREHAIEERERLTAREEAVSARKLALLQNTQTPSQTPSGEAAEKESPKPIVGDHSRNDMYWWNLDIKDPTQRFKSSSVLLPLTEVPALKLALLYMLIPKQGEELLKRIREWDTQPPCSHERTQHFAVPDDEQGSSPSNHPYSRHISLVFYINTDWTNEEEQALQKKIITAITPYLAVPSSMKGKLSPTRCFQADVYWISSYVPPEKDEYPYTNGKMFYNLFHEDVMTENFDYFFLAEPDLYPIRPNWLSRMYDVLLTEHTAGKQGFWVMGSLFRNCEPTQKACQTAQWDGILKAETIWHINGNGFYQLNAPFFNKFLAAVREEYGGWWQDAAQAAWLMQYRHWPTAQQIRHQFVLTDYIQSTTTQEPKENEEIIRTWKRTYPNTYMLHL